MYRGALAKAAPWKSYPQAIRAYAKSAIETGESILYGQWS